MGAFAVPCYVRVRSHAHADMSKFSSQAGMSSASASDHATGCGRARAVLRQVLRCFGHLRSLGLPEQECDRGSMQSRLHCR